MAKRVGLGSLGGRAVVITGAAHGIGRELAQQLWAKGCHLALLDRDALALEVLHAELTQRINAQRSSDSSPPNPPMGGLGGSSQRQRCTLHVVDVGDSAQMERAAREVSEAHVTVHGLINNAGVGHEAPLQNIALETWRRVVDVNLWGVIHGCHFFLPLLARADRAHIINMSSLFGLMGMAGQAPYCTTKYAVRGFSESLWEELRDTSISLTVVHPGSIATDIMARAEGDDPELMQHLVGWYRDHAYPPARAAAQIVRALERGPARLRITAESVVVDLVKRVFPVWGNQLVCALILRVLKLGHMRARRKEAWQRMVAGK